MAAAVVIAMTESEREDFYEQANRNKAQALPENDVSLGLAHGPLAYAFDCQK